jgi:hypothetical protein
MPSPSGSFKSTSIAGIARRIGARERGGRGESGVHGETSLPQLITHCARGLTVVFAEQNAFGACRGFGVGLPAGGPVPGRQFDMKDRAAARRVARANLAAVSFDDLPDDVEAEAGSALLPGVCPISLCELFENACPEIGRNT